MGNKGKSKSEFFAKYERPEWQMKRLEILKRADCACEWCDDTESRLEIHHTYYLRDTDPWDYPSESLRCLCSDCHEAAQEYMVSIKKLFGLLTLDNTIRVYGYMQGLALSQDASSDRVFHIDDFMQAIGMCDAAGASPEGYSLPGSGSEGSATMNGKAFKAMQDSWVRVQNNPNEAV